MFHPYKLLHILRFKIFLSVTSGTFLPHISFIQKRKKEWWQPIKYQSHDHKPCTRWTYINMQKSFVMVWLSKRRLRYSCSKWGDMIETTVGVQCTLGRATDVGGKEGLLVGLFTNVESIHLVRRTPCAVRAMSLRCILIMLGDLLSLVY